MKKVFDHVRHLLSIMEECDTGAEGSLCAHSAAAACFKLLSQEKKKAGVQISLDQFFKNVGEMLSEGGTSSQR
jgi:hypothetical protein